MLIIFDRLFGTLAVERPDEPIRYGLSHRRPTRNPVRLVFREWVGMLADAFAARTAGGLARALFSPPGNLRNPK